MPGVWKRWDGTQWVPQVGAPQAQPGLLAFQRYNPASQEIKNAGASTTLTPFDTTNCKVTFTVPASGSVKHIVNATHQGGNDWIYTGLRDAASAGAELTGSLRRQSYGTLTIPLFYEHVETGLTPGASITRYFAGKHVSGLNQLLIGGDYGPFQWSVWDAQTGAGVMVPAQPPLLYVRDEKAAGTHGGNLTADTWQTRTLNTVVINEISGASLSSNEVTLPAGTYEVDASAPGRGVAVHQARLYNVTGAAVLLTGTSEYAHPTSDSQSRSRVFGRFTLGATSVVRLEHNCDNTRSSTGAGEGATFTGHTIEVYADVMIRKVA